MVVTAVSLFSGCGGFDLGARDAGVTVLWANDKHADSARTYRKYLPDAEFVCGDIRAIDMACLPNADLLFGCYPCQGFSAGAWRRWKQRPDRDLLSNPENYLFLEFMKAVRHVDPKFIVIENVKGLKSSLGGYFFTAQKEMLEGMGFHVYSECLNAHDYGAAQTRQRVFIVGVHKALGHEYTFPLSTHGPGKLDPRRQIDVIADLPEWPKGEFEETPFHGHYLSRNRKRPWDQPSYTIVASSRHVTLHPGGEPMTRVGIDKWATQGAFNRRLSWLEAAELQSFPHDFEPEGSLVSKYWQIGNAVPPILSRCVLSPIVTYLEGIMHCSNNERGREEFKNAMWRKSPDGQFTAYEKTNPYQPMLLDPDTPDLAPLEQALWSEFGGKHVRIHDLDRWLLGYDYRETHMHTVLQALFKSGAVQIEGPEKRLVFSHDPELVFPPKQP